MEVNIRIFLVLSFGLAFGALIVSVVALNTEERLAYANTLEVYEKFDYKIELQNKFKQFHASHKIILDSLKFKFDIQSNALDSTNVNELRALENTRNEYMLFGAKFKEEEGTLQKEYFDKIWKQLDLYSKEFCKQQGFKYVFGVKGEGNLIYADEGENVTEELLMFVNQKYQNE